MSPTSSFDALQRHKYVNVETFRQSGQGVRTPVWFAGDPASGTPQTLYVYSEAESGKAKRIRRNPQVRVAPCDARGHLPGPEWIEARAGNCDRRGSAAWHAPAEREIRAEASIRRALEAQGSRARGVRDPAGLAAASELTWLLSPARGYCGIDVRQIEACHLVSIFGFQNQIAGSLPRLSGVSYGSAVYRLVARQSMPSCRLPICCNAKTADFFPVSSAASTAAFSATDRAALVPVTKYVPVGS